METDAIDLKYAREAAEYIGSRHTEILITRDQVIAALPEVIKALGTYDITTIRASMGMYLLCQAIHETTDVRVLLSPGRSPTSCSVTSTQILPPPRRNSRRNP